MQTIVELIVMSNLLVKIVGRKIDNCMRFILCMRLVTDLGLTTVISLRGVKPGARVHFFVFKYFGNCPLRALKTILNYGRSHPTP